MRTLLVLLGAAVLVALTLALDGSPVLAFALGTVYLLVAAAGPAARALLARARRLIQRRDETLAELVRVARDAYIEVATHGSVSANIAAVVQTGTRLGGTAAAAAAQLSELDRRIHETLDRQAQLRITGIRPIEPAAITLEDLTLKRYGTRASHPRWLPRPLSAFLEQVGLVLDEVRALHTATIERAVLLFTFWSRLLALALAPVLAGATFALPPLDGGFSARDVPWVVATLVCAVTALSAGPLADAMMDRGDRGARVRRRMLRLEVPIAIAVAVCSPAWFVCIFATGWTNYEQRPEFDWPKLARFLGVLTAAQVIGLVLDDVVWWEGLVEVGATWAAIGITGGSYGAMLPVSAFVLFQTLRSGSAARYRSAVAAREDLLMAAGALELVARELRAQVERRDDPALLNVHSLAERTGRELRDAVALLERGGGVAPSGLNALAGVALASAEIPGELEAWDLPEEERRVTALDPEFIPRQLASRRISAAKHRKAIAEILHLLLEEAKFHGAGAVTMRIALQASRLSLVVANPIRDDDEQGRGTGAGKLEAARARLPGAELAEPRQADGAELDRPGEWLYIAELTVDAAILDNPAG